MAEANADHVFAAIEEHKRLRAIAYYSGVDQGPEHEAACEAEESALQALGDIEQPALDQHSRHGLRSIRPYSGS